MSNDGWIKLKDRLPEDNQQILFFVDITKSKNNQKRVVRQMLHRQIKFVEFGYAHIEEYEKGKFLSYVSRDQDGRLRIRNAEDDFITHWQPLPNPPES